MGDLHILSVGWTDTMARSLAASPRCLVIEDEVLIGMDLEDNLYQAGFDVRWAVSARAASELLTSVSFHVAILDVIVRSEPCVTLASELKQRRIPFLVYSGHPRDDAIAFQDVPWLQKPAEIEMLLKALSGILDAPCAAPSNGIRELSSMPHAGSR